MTSTPAFSSMPSRRGLHDRKRRKPAKHQSARHTPAPMLPKISKDGRKVMPISVAQNCTSCRSLRIGRLLGGCTQAYCRSPPC